MTKTRASSYHNYATHEHHPDYTKPWSYNVSCNNAMELNYETHGKGKHYRDN